VSTGLDNRRIDTAKLGHDIYVVCASGALDGPVAIELKETLFPLAGQRGARIVIDLGGADFVDATAAGILTAAAHVMRNGGGELVIVTRDPRIERLFEETGLHSLARVERTLREGVERAVGSASA
jgi:anti-sigma B factor antagonist